MPQIAKYRVAVGLRRGGTLATPVLQTKVPDIVTAAEVERQLHARFQNEWAEAARGPALLDLELVGDVAGDWSFLVDTNGVDHHPGGQIAVHPEEVAWLQTIVTWIGPEQAAPPPTGVGGGAGPEGAAA